jgi:prophage maintenance system killer protein
MALISKQALIYLYDQFVEESLIAELPVQDRIREDQIEKIYSIIENAENSFFGIKPNKSLLQKISHILCGINKQHPLIDGNKRFSLVIAIYLLEHVGKNSKKIAQTDWEMLIMRIASDREFDVKQTAEYLEEKLKI